MKVTKQLIFMFLLSLSYVAAVEILIPRNVENITYIDCYHATAYEYVVENVTMTQPYPGSWDGMKGYIAGPRCFQHCINKQYLYAAITVQALSPVTMELACSCGNVRYYWNDRSTHHCHWNCTDWDDPIEEWCAYPDHHGATHLFELPGPEWPEVMFVNCNKNLFDGPIIANRALYKARTYDIELWSARFYIEDCFYECSFRGYRYIGVHSFWNGKTMEMECRCAHAMPKRGDEPRFTFCPWRCTYYRRYPYRWCSYHADKWWSTVYQIVDEDYPQDFATPYPTPLPINPEQYMMTTEAYTGLDNYTSAPGISHHPRGPFTEFRPPDTTVSGVGRHQPAAPVMVGETDDMLLGLNFIELICFGVAAVLLLILVIMCSVMVLYCRRRKKLENTTQQHIEVTPVSSTGSVAGLIPQDDTV